MRRFISRLHIPGSRASFRASYLLLLLLLLAACDSDTGPLPVVPPTPTATLVPPTPTRGVHPRAGTLTIRAHGDPSSLNPWLCGTLDASARTDCTSVTSLIFRGLTRLDNRLQPQPDLADSWDVSDEGTAIVFHIRPGVTWHDGSPFTVQDVIWSYQILRQLPPNTSDLLQLQDTITSVEPGDPAGASVRFTLKRRFSPVLTYMAMPILPSHVLSGTTAADLAVSPFNQSPIGTGPYTFDKRDPGRSITLKANSRFYVGEPFISQVAFLVAPDVQIAEDAVRDGRLMLAQVPPNDAEGLVKSGKGIRGGAYDESGYDFVAFNLRPTHIFSDTRLRQAFALAIDKPGLAFQATGGGGDPVWSDVPKTSWAYNPGLPKLGGDPEAARKLIADAGWSDTNKDGIADRNGKPLEVVLYVPSNNDVRKKAANAMVEPLRRVGIRLKVQIADFNTSLLGRLSPNSRPPFDFDVMILGWTRTGLDPDPFALFHSSQIPTPSAPTLLNFTGFAAPEYDTLALDARSTYDYGARKAKYMRMQEIIADQLPYYFLWAEKFGVVAAPKLQGDIDFSSPLYMWNIDQWWIQP